jgi:hypothetical protein
MNELHGRLVHGEADMEKSEAQCFHQLGRHSASGFAMGVFSDESSAKTGSPAELPNEKS